MRLAECNILVIWVDDIGAHNTSTVNHGVMGYQTPNIDRIANEGAMFPHADAQWNLDELWHVHRLTALLPMSV